MKNDFEEKKNLGIKLRKSIVNFSREAYKANYKRGWIVC